MARGGKQPGAGRPKGMPNKNTQQIRNMILQAVEMRGGAEYFYEQAEKNPGPFMTLVGKVLPKQIVGADDGPVQIVEMTTAELTKIAAGKK